MVLTVRGFNNLTSAAFIWQGSCTLAPVPKTLPQEEEMKKVQVLLSVLGIAAGLWLAASLALAQSSPSSSHDAAVQQEPAPPPDAPNAASETKTFTGKIMKSGDKLVLSDAESKTTYQLDDQQKARAFVNKNVKVTGILDASTGVIRVSDIEPA
jgi:hypothetical protein